MHGLTLSVDWSEVFESLLRAEQEDDAISHLVEFGLWDDASLWRELGDNENNFSIVSNQQTDPTGALVEKIINSIDATLMAGCYQAGLAPDGDFAPRTMNAAAETFFGIPRGRLGDLTPTELTDLALLIQLVAVGSKQHPSYLIIDTDGEGQSPASFPETFCSLARSNKLRIPFVQGKFNAGGTGVLQFCGKENLQLVASKRHPNAPAAPDDPTVHRWGFTVIRRLEPYENRKNSTYVYLAPSGSVPTFNSDELMVLPGDSRKNEPAKPYTEPIGHGTVIKLYDYRWPARSVATTDARFELEKYLHAPTLPFRITETRSYRANYYSTTVSGIWASIHSEEGIDPDKKRVEAGFPTPATLNLDPVGPLHYRSVVFREDKVDPRRIPSGVYFTVNGQVHGTLPSSFVAQALQFEYLKDHLFVSVDCTDMQPRVREDFFMASRDRLRKNENYQLLYSALRDDLRDHPGLKELNAARRARRIKQSLESEDDVLQTLDQLLERDPALRVLFDFGDRLVTKVGPTERELFRGVRFPTYFRIKGSARETRKESQLGGTLRIEFEIDAVNDYFDRDNSPGEFHSSMADSLEHSRLWNGVFVTRWRPPQESRVGDVIDVLTTVSDADRDAKGLPPFENRFSLEIVEPRPSRPRPDHHRRKRKGPDDGNDTAPRLSLPRITEVRRDSWGTDFDELTAYRVRRNGASGFDYFVNMDNAYLVTELTKTRSDRDVITYWFKWGLTLCALGMLHHLRQRDVEADEPDSADGTDALEMTNRSLDGLGAVIVPVIRNLYRGPEGT